MPFNSLVFVAYFAVLLGLYYSTQSWQLRKSILLGGSYVFYAAWNPPFVILLWLSTLIDWTVAKRMFHERSISKRKMLLSISVISNLGMLGFFKYGNFLLDNFEALLGVAGLVIDFPDAGIILPVGISFYTFQTLSYTIDVYRKKTEPSRSALDFALYVTFFPQLVAGPIVRSTDFLPQCVQSRSANSTMFLWGLCLITFGLFQKVVLADTLLSPAADTVFGHLGRLDTIDAWIGALAFSGQIFCDFSGYTLCAIGTALCFGFHLPDNFRYPYAAVGFRDFWRRWHITLSTWLRDYLYIPLGGNRHGAFRMCMSLMITMALGGLWHGASWNFVVWGIIHGLLLVAERLVMDYVPERFKSIGFLGRSAIRVLTFLSVTTVWVFFRSPSFSGALEIIGSMLSLSSEGAKILPMIEILKVSIAMSFIVGMHWVMADSNIESLTRKLGNIRYSSALASIFVLLVITQGAANAFIYFQF